MSSGKGRGTAVPQLRDHAKIKVRDLSPLTPAVAAPCRGSCAGT